MKMSDTDTDNAAKARVIDSYLVGQARLGGRRAFDELVRRWHKRLVAHAWRLTGDGDAARDAVQAAWLEIVRGLPSLRDDAAFPAWAFRIVSRRAARAIDARRRERDLAKAYAAEPSVEDEPVHAADAGEAARLQRAIAALPPVQRAAIGLYYTEGMSVAEAAVALDVPVGTVKTRLMHARRALRAALEGESDERRY